MARNRKSVVLLTSAFAVCASGVIAYWLLDRKLFHTEDELQGASCLINFGVRDRVPDEFIVTFKTEVELRESGDRSSKHVVLGGQLPVTDESANQLANALATLVGGQILGYYSPDGMGRYGFGVKSPEGKVLKLIRDSRIKCIEANTITHAG